MSRLRFTKITAPDATASGKAELYVSTDAAPGLRIVDDTTNFNISEITNTNVVAQSPAAARAYIAGSDIHIPVSGLKVGTILRWHLSVYKTSAGTATSVYDIAFGTAGTTADTARVSFTKPAGSAAADEGTILITAVVRTIGAAGVVAGQFTMTHNLASTGHMVIPSACVNTVSAGFDTTDATHVGICITGGLNDAITLQVVTAEALNL